MKQKFIAFIAKTLVAYYKFSFKRKLSKLSNEKIAFIDIDNTIADTWPQIKSGKFYNAFERTKHLPVHQKMKEYIVQRFLDNKNVIPVYLTARHFSMTHITKTWLKTNGFWSSKSELIVVSHPSQKIDFIKMSLKNDHKVVYVDDLSRNHENGEVKFYSKEIEMAQSLDIEYIDYQKILEINNA